MFLHCRVHRGNGKGRNEGIWRALGIWLDGMRYAYQRPVVIHLHSTTSFVFIPSLWHFKEGLQRESGKIFMFQQDWEGLGDVTDLDLEKLAIVFFGAKTSFYQYYTGYFVQSDWHYTDLLSSPHIVIYALDYRLLLSRDYSSALKTVTLQPRDVL